MVTCISKLALPGDPSKVNESVPYASVKGSARLVTLRWHVSLHWLRGVVSRYGLTPGASHYKPSSSKTWVVDETSFSSQSGS